MSESELRLLRESIRTALEDLSSPTAVREQMASDQGWDPRTWRRLCRELGIAGLAVPEDDGGSGFSLTELGVVFEEAGRTLLCAPLMATAGLTIPLLQVLGDEAANKRYLPGLCDGTTVGAVVTSDEFGRSVLEGALVRADMTGGTPTLTGTAGFVIDGASADLILLPARTEDGIAVFAVDTQAPGVTKVPLVSLDQTRRQATVTFAKASATRLSEGDATAAFVRALDIARTLLAAEQAGGASRCLDMAVTYAKTRVQFGRPIGSFQALKQKLADVLIQVESAKSAAEAGVQAAALVLDPSAVVRIPGLPDLPTVAAVAQLYCSEAYVTVAADTIQIHGGIGFTWEHDAHLYYKRAWGSREMLGRPEEHIERLSELLGSEVS
jgi:alkylation response protein AidB-like acyl-CoA dehydrogenase